MVKRENNPNDLAKEFFKFKQFDVYHERGFKVSTEACIFGAYISKNFKSEKVLDIGTGTGLLSLMYAQNNTSKITAIEINEEAAQEANRNFERSPFSELEVVHNNVVDWALLHEGNYDLVLTNPPFFKNHLLGLGAYQNSAKHQESLSFDTLAKISAHLLKDKGCLAILLPVYEQNIFQQKISEFGYYPYRVLNVFNKPNSDQFRKIVVYAMANESKEDKLVIYNSDNTYTEKFKELLKEYYTIF